MKERCCQIASDPLLSCILFLKARLNSPETCTIISMSFCLPRAVQGNLYCTVKA